MSMFTKAQLRAKLLSIKLRLQAEESKEQIEKEIEMLKRETKNYVDTEWFTKNIQELAASIEKGWQGTKEKIDDMLSQLTDQEKTHSQTS